MPSLFSFPSTVAPRRLFSRPAKTDAHPETSVTEKKNPSPNDPTVSLATRSTCVSPIATRSTCVSPEFLRCILTEGQTSHFAVVEHLVQEMRLKSLRHSSKRKKKHSSSTSRDDVIMSPDSSTSRDSVFLSSSTTGVSSYCSSSCCSEPDAPLGRLSSRTRTRILAMLSLKRSQQLSKTLVCGLHVCMLDR